jgi:hypothetical protein
MYYDYAVMNAKRRAREQVGVFTVTQYFIVISQGSICISRDACKTQPLSAWKIMAFLKKATKLWLLSY